MANLRRWSGHVASRWLEGRLIAAPRWHPPVEQRRCAVHLAMPAVDRCDACGRPFCAACFQAVGRWRVCTACVARLERERTRTPLGERLRERWPSALAAVVFAALLGGAVLAMNRGTSGAISATSLVGSARKVACLQSYPDPATLYVVGGLPLYGTPPEHLVLETCDFRPDEGAIVTGGIAGYDFHGQPLFATLAPARARAGDDGVLAVTVAIPNPMGFEGAYRITLRATGGAGSSAAAFLHAEGNIAPPTPGPA